MMKMQFSVIYHRLPFQLLATGLMDIETTTSFP